MVERYVAHLDPADEPLGVERTVATRTDRIAVSGRIDRLDQRRDDAGGPELVVVDYKTGRRVLTADDARGALALALYAVAAARVMRRPCHRVELHHLPTGEVAAWDHTPEGLARQLARAEDIADECAAADESYRAGLAPDRVDDVFPPHTGPGCGWCDYLRQCPAGLAVTAPRDPWSALGRSSAVPGKTRPAPPGGRGAGLSATSGRFPPGRRPSRMTVTDQPLT